jgi:hypothetical protein
MGESIVAVLVGALAGLHAATWGMYKDSLYEGFSWRKYGRSVAVGALAALALQALLPGDLYGAAGVVVLFGLTYVAERGLVEWHKSFVRVEDQSKYFIPMQFAVGGQVVHGRATRLIAGLVYAGALAAIAMGLLAVERRALSLHPVAVALLLGSIGGWVSALGGAWKDAPKEGFQLFKFFRSPAIAAGFGLLLSTLTHSYLAIAFGGLGYSIATIETHKKFRRSLEAPGKFAGTPVRFPEMVVRRRPFAVVFASVWALVLAAMAVALAGPADGLVATFTVAAR